MKSNFIQKKKESLFLAITTLIVFFVAAIILIGLACQVYILFLIFMASYVIKLHRIFQLDKLNFILISFGVLLVCSLINQDTNVFIFSLICLLIIGIITLILKK